MLTQASSSLIHPTPETLALVNDNTVGGTETQIEVDAKGEVPLNDPNSIWTCHDENMIVGDQSMPAVAFGSGPVSAICLIGQDRGAAKSRNLGL
jgi:hypothetical protein